MPLGNPLFYRNAAVGSAARIDPGVQEEKGAHLRTSLATTKFASKLTNYLEKCGACGHNDARGVGGMRVWNRRADYGFKRNRQK